MSPEEIEYNVSLISDDTIEQYKNKKYFLSGIRITTTRYNELDVKYYKECKLYDNLMWFNNKIIRNSDLPKTIKIKKDLIIENKVNDFPTHIEANEIKIFNSIIKNKIDYVKADKCILNGCIISQIPTTLDVNELCLDDPTILNSTTLSDITFNGRLDLDYATSIEAIKNIKVDILDIGYDNKLQHYENIESNAIKIRSSKIKTFKNINTNHLCFFSTDINTINHFKATNINLSNNKLPKNINIEGKYIYLSLSQYQTNIEFDCDVETLMINHTRPDNKITYPIKSDYNTKYCFLNEVGVINIDKDMMIENLIIENSIVNVPDDNKIKNIYIIKPNENIKSGLLTCSSSLIDKDIHKKFKKNYVTWVDTKDALPEHILEAKIEV